MNWIKYLYSYRSVKWFIIPIILLIIAIGGVIYEIVRVDSSLSVISQNLDVNDFEEIKFSELHAGERISASFQANSDYLGIIAVRFYNFQKISDDSLVFRIKERGSKNWYYEGKYTVAQFQPDELFTFGFPIIPDSSGKYYYFELESVSGQKGNAIAISKKEPILVAKYQFTKDTILGNSNNISRFLIGKVSGLLTNFTFSFSALIYFIPLIYYILWQVFHSKKKKKLIFISFLPIYAMIADIIMVDHQIFLTDIVIIIVSFSWILSIFTYKFDNSISYIVAIFLLVLCMVLLVFGFNENAEKAAVWSYMLLIIGTIHGFIEFKLGRYGNYTYKKLLSDLHIK